ncbi:unnamed protein product [Closterium sp. NIES-53]
MWTWETMARKGSGKASATKAWQGNFPCPVERKAPAAAAAVARLVATVGIHGGPVGVAAASAAAAEASRRCICCGALRDMWTRLCMSPSFHISLLSNLSPPPLHLPSPLPLPISVPFTLPIRFRPVFASVGVLLLQLLTGWAGPFRDVDGQRTHIYHWVRKDLGIRARCGMAWHGMAGQSRHGMAGMGWHRPTSPSSHYPLPTPHLPSSRSPLLPAHLPILFPYPWPPLFPHPQARQHAESGDISPLLDPLLPHPPPPPATLLPLFHLALACSSPSQSARPTPVSALDVVRLVRTSLLEGSQSGRGIGGENGEKGKGEGGRKGEKGEGGGGGRRDDGGENEGGGRGESGGEWSGVSIGESSEGVAEQSADNTRLPLVGAAEDSSESMV